MGVIMMDRRPDIGENLRTWMQQDEQRKAIEAQYARQDEMMSRQQADADKARRLQVAQAQIAALHPSQRQAALRALPPDLQAYIPINEAALPAPTLSDQEIFQQQVAAKNRSTFGTLPDSAHQAGTYQAAYGAAAPAETVGLMTSQDVYSNKDRFAPEVARGQRINDKIDPSGYESGVLTETNRHNVTSEGFDRQRTANDTRRTGADVALRGAQTNAVTNPQPDATGNMRDERQIRSDFRKDFGKFIEADKMLEQAEAYAAQRTGSGDQMLLIAALSAIDGSVTREGEVALARKTAGIPQRIRAKLANWKEGDLLDDTTRANIINAAREARSMSEPRRQEVLGYYNKLATDYGMDPGRITGLAGGAAAGGGAAPGVIVYDDSGRRVQ